MVKISVIIPAYEDGQHISKALDSVLSQHYPDFEIVVVDDGSTDNTPEILRRYIAAGNGKIRCFRQHNQGVSAARNKGIREARGEYICFLDADDIFCPNGLEKRVRALDLFPEAEFGFGLSLLIHKNGREQLFSTEALRGLDLIRPTEGIFYLLKPSQRERILLTKTEAMNTNCVVLRKVLFQRIGYFDEKLSVTEDTDLWNRILLTTDQIVAIRFPLSAYSYFLRRWDKDLLSLYFFQRRTMLNKIALLRRQGFTREHIRGAQRSILKRKYLVYGVEAYRKGMRYAALRLFSKSFSLDRRDLTILPMFLKCLLPFAVREYLRKLRDRLADRGCND